MQPIRAIVASIPEPTLSDKTKKILEKLNPLGVTIFERNIINFKQLKKLIKDIKEVLGPDVLIAIDQEGGRVCRLTLPDWPEYTASRSWGMLSQAVAKQALELQAQLMADDFRKIGINLDYAPVLDVRNSKTSNALASRCFSEDPKKVTELGSIVLNTLQKGGILACIKHLPGHGRATVDPHLHLPIIKASFKEMEEDFYPFQKLSPDAFIGMTAHIVFPDIDTLPITLSERAIRLLIRDHIGFKGFLLSDALDMKALPGTIFEKAERSLKAGCDAVCYCFGDDDVLEKLIDTVPYLSDEALERLSKIQVFLKQNINSAIFDREQVLLHYQKLQKKAPILPEDYDVVETLHKMKQS